MIYSRVTLVKPGVLSTISEDQYSGHFHNTCSIPLLRYELSQKIIMTSTIIFNQIISVNRPFGSRQISPRVSSYTERFQPINNQILLIGLMYNENEHRNVETHLRIRKRVRPQCSGDEMPTTGPLILRQRMQDVISNPFFSHS